MSANTRITLLVAYRHTLLRQALRTVLAAQPDMDVIAEARDLHRSVRVGTAELHLTALEQSLLYLLAANAGPTVTRDEILDGLWGPDFVAGSNVVDRQVRNLRTRLRDDWRRPRFIATVPGRGYRFVPTVRDAAARPLDWGAPFGPDQWLCPVIVR